MESTLDKRVVDKKESVSLQKVLASLDDNPVYQYPFAMKWITSTPNMVDIRKVNPSDYLSSFIPSNYSLLEDNLHRFPESEIHTIQKCLKRLKEQKQAFFAFAVEYHGIHCYLPNSAHGHLALIYNGEDSIYLCYGDNELFDYEDGRTRMEKRKRYKNFCTYSEEEQKELLQNSKDKNEYKIVRIDRASFVISVVANTLSKTEPPLAVFKDIFYEQTIQVFQKKGIMTQPSVYTIDSLANNLNSLNSYLSRLLIILGDQQID